MGFPSSFFSSAPADYRHGPTPLRIVQEGPFTVEAPGCQPVAGETIPRRHPKARDGLVEHPAPGVNTTFDLLRRSAELYADEPAAASRTLLRVHREKKAVPKLVDGKMTTVEREWSFAELSDYAFLTYREYFALVLQVGAGLRKLGLAPRERLHVFASTSLQWLAMAHACSSQSLTIVTAYDTLGERGVEHSLVQSGAVALFVEPHLLKTVSSPLRAASPAVRFLVYNDLTTVAPLPADEIAAFAAAHPTVKVLSFSELRALGEENPAEPVPPAADETYCIMYTSGSTGPPKGVPVSHAGFVAAVAGLYTVMEDAVSKDEFVMAYLPLAHIFELVLENLVVFVGATLGYGSPRTLSDSGVRNCRGDMATFAPTIMVGVPQVWETVRKGIEGKVAAQGGVTAAAFRAGLCLKSFLVRHGLPGGDLLDRLVFKKVRDATGGRLRFVVNGASGISEPTLRFMSLVVAPMLSGYGLTETCGNGALGCPLQWTPGPAIGPVPASVEVKLVAIPDLGYHTDGVATPQGEILIRGKPVLTGYLDCPEETAKALTEDGWFRTGDIGEITPRGHIAVVDRVKNLVKLQGGEYIALEKLEAVYRGAECVNNIMVHGDAACPRPIAVIVVEPRVLAAKALEFGVSEEEVLEDRRMKGYVMGEVGAIAKREKFSNIETLAGVVLAGGEWTPDSGLVTATQKVSRRVVREHYAKQIAACLAGI
ncbi:hypothetical protein C8A05DRAFT_31446 [Staphylotrichum tortipilum]|uniref:AMP-dependent synthetase/ligase domain-containing protein n=1 Tax=Staphylotrichum tortipilum TaxID=2831512 RepID=A0AAN6RVY2_9PEZI|nr:hypothetical protein C8A05DRAFT_31446 [Staphylotrichum longicolle]